MGLAPVDEDTEALPVTAADVDGFITKSLDEVDIFFLILKKFSRKSISDRKEKERD